jgi:hypothetical protein
LLDGMSQAAAGAGNPLEMRHLLAGLGVGSDFSELAHPPGAAIGAVAVEEDDGRSNL